MDLPIPIPGLSFLFALCWWIAECVLCSARARVGSEALARQWETAHAQHGCGHRLVRDETGRGWMPDQFAIPSGLPG